MNLLQSLWMGLVSGFAEMLPVSAEAHRTLFRLFFDIPAEDPLFRFLVHGGILVALNLAYSGEILALRQASHLMKISPRRRKKPLDPGYATMVKLLKSATLVMVLCRCLTMPLAFLGKQLNYLAFPLVVNGILLLLPSLLPSGNMTGRNMPRIFGLSLGLGAGLGVVPGISPLGATVSIGQCQGVERGYCLKFAHILLIPTLGVEMVFDLVDLCTGGAVAFSALGLFGAILGAIAAGVGAFWGIRWMKQLAQGNGFGPFAYYSWGLAICCFALFLMI